MQLQITTDYAIRILRYLYNNEGSFFTANEISSSLGISYQYFMKIVNKLIKAEVVESIQGRKGGYTIAGTGKSINMYDVIKIMEGEIKLNRCLEEDGYCSNNCTGNCNVKVILSGVQAELIEKLISVKIHDF